MSPSDRTGRDVDLLIQAIQRAAILVPYQRIGQIISNAMAIGTASGLTDTYYIQDTELARLINQYCTTCTIAGYR